MRITPYFATRCISSFMLLILIIGCSNSNGIPKKYPSSKALKNGDVVFISTSAKPENINKLEQFIKDWDVQSDSQVRITTYTDEGDPIIMELEADGSTIQYRYDNTRDKYAGDFKGVAVAKCKKITSELKSGKNKVYLDGCEWKKPRNGAEKSLLISYP